jgi:hypothetical protein
MAVYAQAVFFTYHSAKNEGNKQFFQLERKKADISKNFNIILTYIFLGLMFTFYFYKFSRMPHFAAKVYTGLLHIETASF